MYQNKIEKEFIIDLFINDFKIFLYNNMVNGAAGTEHADIDLDNSIKHTIDYLLSRLYYKEEKLTQEEIKERIDSSEDRIVMIETNMSDGLQFDWHRFMSKLDDEGFDAELVLYNLYDVYPRITSDLKDDEKKLKIQDLRKRVAGFIDEWFLDEQLQKNANKQKLDETISTKTYKN